MYLADDKINAHTLLCVDRTSEIGEGGFDVLRTG